MSGSVWGEKTLGWTKENAALSKPGSGAGRAWLTGLAPDNHQERAGRIREWDRVNWRRIIGATLMILGGAAVVAMAVLASVVIGNYVEWENAADALGAVALVTVPPAAIGFVLMFIGRLVYGDWLERSPVVNASALAIQIAGAVVSLGLGAMLVFLAATGITADDQTTAAALGIGTTAGLAMIFLGFRIKSGSGRSYLD